MLKNSESSLTALGQTVSLLFTSVFLLFVLGYSIFQSRYLLLGPSLKLDNNLKTVQGSRGVTLKGTARNISHLWLNDRPIYTNLEGVFEEVLILENGYTVATIKATDRYGREEKIKKEFFYKDVSD